jgi:hypothetical protein
MRTLRWVEGVVAEAQSSLDQGAEAAGNEGQGQAPDLSHLERCILLIWAQVFESSSGIWPFFGTVGTALRLYSEAIV